MAVAKADVKHLIATVALEGSSLAAIPSIIFQRRSQPENARITRTMGT